MERKELIYLDSNGNKTDKEHAVEVVIRIYNESGDLIGRRIEPIENETPKIDQGRFGENQTANIPECQKPKAPQISETWVCPNDETVNAGERCIICGIPRPEKEKNENVVSSDGQNVTDKPKARKKLLLIVAAFVLLAVVCSGFLIWSGGRSPEYVAAEKLEKSGRTAEAAMAFYAMGDKERSFELWDKVAVRDTVSSGCSHTVGLKSDGTVVAVGQNYYGQCDVNDWKDIVSISTGGKSLNRSYTIGLKSDGTVVAVGGNDDGQCNVSDWKDIVAINADNRRTVGLKSDGTVVAVGYNEDGQCDVSGWKNIVAISVGGAHTVGLKADGTLVAVGYNEYGQCDVSGWKDIVAISVGFFHTVGLKADGTLVAVGYNGDGQCDVSGWNDIVATSAGNNHTVGLKSDGTVVAVGNNYAGQCDVSGWKDIVAISAGDYYTVGLKADGTVVAVGDNDSGQCDVADWKNIRLPSNR